jgi:hypothetical protein
MAKNVNQTELVTEKVVGKYELVFDAPRMRGRGKVSVTSFGPTETHTMILNNQTIGTFVNRIGAHQDEGETYYGKGVLGKGNLLAGALAMQLAKARLKFLSARRKKRGK